MGVEGAWKLFAHTGVYVDVMSAVMWVDGMLHIHVLTVNPKFYQSECFIGPWRFVKTNEGIPPQGSRPRVGD